VPASFNDEFDFELGHIGEAASTIGYGFGPRVFVGKRYRAACAVDQQGEASANHALAKATKFAHRRAGPH
jgi:hypothetical protein